MKYLKSYKLFESNVEEYPENIAYDYLEEKDVEYIWNKICEETEFSDMSYDVNFFDYLMMINLYQILLMMKYLILR